MSVSTEHRISKVYRTLGDTNKQSRIGQHGGASAARLSRSSRPGGPATGLAPADSLLNPVARAPQQGVPSPSGFLWAGDGI